MVVDAKKAHFNRECEEEAFVALSKELGGASERVKGGRSGLPDDVQELFGKAK